METIETILQQIKNRGGRYSKTREAILDSLVKNPKPLCYVDLQKILATRNVRVNKTTVYRELNFLMGEGVIRGLQFDDGMAYYEITSKGHHHHIICNSCRSIDHVELDKDLVEQEKLIAKTKRFKILRHSLEFYGLCHACQSHG